MRSIIGSSIKFRLGVLAIAAATLILGVPQLRSMPKDVLPEFLPTTVEVQTEALGLSAIEMEQLITVPLENYLLNGLSFLDSIRSESIAGLSSVELTFEPGTDLLVARQVVQERLTGATALPRVAKAPQMLQPTSATNRVTMVGLSSEELSLIDLSVLARWTIRPRLMGVSGVANVSIFGQRERQIQVQIDPARLRRMGVTLQQVISTTGNSLWVSPLSFLEASTPGSGGFIETPNQRLGIRHVLPITSPADLARVVVEDQNGRKALRLGDVATVIEDHQPLIGDAMVDAGKGLMLVIEKFPNANTVDVTREVEQALESMKPGLQGVTIEPAIYRPANYIEDALGNVGVALAIGLALAIILILGLASLRGAVIAAVAIAVSTVASAVVLGMMNAGLNAMVIAGFVAMLVVVLDDAITDPDAISRRIAERGVAAEGTMRLTTIARASAEIRQPLLFATLIAMLAMVPLFFTGGMIGAFLPAFAKSAIVALLASTLVALTVTPALCTLLHRGSAHGGTKFATGLVGAHARVLGRTSLRGAFGLLAVLGLAGLLAVPFLRQPETLIPTLQERDLLLSIEGVAGTSAIEMNRIAGRMSNELRALPGIRNVDGHIGRAVMSDQVAAVNSTELWVGIEPFAAYDETVTAIRDIINGYPGLDAEVISFPNERVREVLTGAEEPVAVRVFGDDLDILRSKAAQVRDVIAPIPGITDLEVEFPREEPNVEIQVDLAAARKYRIKPGDVRRAAATVVNGIEVGNLFEEQKVFEVIVIGVPRVRATLPTIRQMLIDTPDGRQVRLSEVADVRIAASPRAIEHESVFRHIDVVASVRGRDVGDVLNEVETAVKQVSFPLQYHAELVGEHADRQGARNRLIAMAIATGIGVLLLLQACLRSWRMASLSFVALTAALSGGAVALLIGGRTLSFGSVVGFLGVFVLAARQIVVMVDRFRALENEGVQTGPDLIARGARERVVPVVTTIGASLLVIAPIIAMGTTAGLEILRPMAIVMAGGLITSMAVTLVALPRLHERFGFVHEEDAWSDVIVLPETDPLRKPTEPTTTIS